MVGMGGAILCTIFLNKCSERIQRWYDVLSRHQISGIPLGAAYTRYQLSINLSIKVNHAKLHKVKLMS